MSKYEVGYKAIVEIDKVFEQDGEKLYRAKGMKSLVFDKKGLDKLEPIDKYKRVNLNMGRRAGQNEAWELVRKIILRQSQGGMNDEDYKGAFGSGVSETYVIKNYTYQEAASKVAEWEKGKDEIKVGDIVKIHEGNDNDLCVLYVSTDKKYYNAVDEYGAVYNMLTKGMITKTGRHIDVDSFLKQIGEE